MTQETTDELEGFFHNKIKDIDATTLEKTIAEAISGLVGVKLKCSVENIAYNGGFGRSGAKFSVSLSEPVSFDFDSRRSK